MRQPSPAAIAAVLLQLCSGTACERPVKSAQGGIPVIEAVEDLRIDAVEHDLGPVSWAGVSPSGVIALIQGQDHAVRLFDSSGKAIATVGREGAGPGEFERPVRGGWIADTLWISDTQLRRVTMIGPQGDLLGTITPSTTITGPPEAVERYAASTPWAMYGRDTLLIWSLRNNDRNETEGPPLIRITVNGFVVGEVTRTPSDDDSGVSVPVGNGVVYGQVPFYPRSYWVVRPDGEAVAILTTDSSDPAKPVFRVRVISARGAELVSRVYPFEPVPIESSALDSALDSHLQRRDPSLRSELENKLRPMAPSIYPGVTGIVLGHDELIWVGLWPKEDSKPWLILDEKGDPLGQLNLKGNQTLVAAARGQAWVVERDTLDLESVVRYRLTWPQRP